MHTLINNEEQPVTVASSIFKELQQDFNNGLWMVITPDVNGVLHCIILPDNYNSFTSKN